ncbi:MAG TPA: hypothetical protein VIR57_18890 [Chloroflexota bacterium]
MAQGNLRAVAGEHVGARLDSAMGVVDGKIRWVLNLAALGSR